MFRMPHLVPRARVQRTTTHLSSRETPVRLPVRTPYLSYWVCAARRLDLLPTRWTRDERRSALSPFC